MVFYHRKGSHSQNFIKEVSVVKQLVDLSSVNKKDLVIEIGPGRGIITTELALRSGQVVAVEKDHLLACKLLLDFQGRENVKIFESDFLKWKLPLLTYKVFSNIPFSITADIINKLLKAEHKPTDIYFIMQKEAAEKYLGNSAETLGSVLVKPWYEVNILKNIDRSNFSPKPQVDIVFTHFLLRHTPLIKEKDQESYCDFITYGFSQWQPTIAQAYKKIFSFSQIKILNKKYKILELKPSQLQFVYWLELFKTYQLFVPDIKKRLISGSKNKH